MTKHTPGPWKANRNKHYFQIDSERDGQIGDTCASLFIEGNTDEGKANAQLMAAAPELLEALEESIEVFKGLASSHHLQMEKRNTNHVGSFYDCQASTCRIAQNKIQKIEDAITKAKGES